MRKAQASLEFLTTYGWMLMVVAMIAGVMAYFGVFSPETNLPQQCDIGFDFSCDKYLLTENGTVRMQSTNKIGEPIEVISFTCMYPNEESHLQDYNDVWNPGESFDLSCNPLDGRGGLIAGERSQVQVVLEYKKVAGGFTQTTTGKIAANVVNGTT